MSYGGKNVRKRGGGGGGLGWGVAALLVGAVGTAAAAWGMGVEVPWLKKPPAAPSLAGLVAVPVLAEPVPAFTRLTREHFFNKKTGTLTFLYLAPREVRPEMLVDLGKILGRVTVRDKQPAYAFTAADLAPVGTRPGIVGGVPAGKRAIVLDAAKVSGLHGLAAGDRCDLLAVVESAPQPGSARRRGSVSLPSGARSPTGKRTMVLVQNGMLVKPVVLREPAKGVGKSAAARSGFEEAVLAVDPAEIAPLTEALAAGAEVVCVARSGRPEEVEGGGVTPGSPQDRLHVVELMVGFERELFVAPEVDSLAAASPKAVAGSPKGAVAEKQTAQPAAAETDRSPSLETARGDDP